MFICMFKYKDTIINIISLLSLTIFTMCDVPLLFTFTTHCMGKCYIALSVCLSLCLSVSKVTAII